MATYLGSDEVGVCIKKEIIVPPHIGEFHVMAIDYDGTVLKEAYVDNGDEFELPSAPTHSGLTFQGWSSPVTITNNKITVSYPDIVIGAVYTTQSGKSEFDIELTPETGLSVTLRMNGTRDWGDGTAVNSSTTHTYSDYGKYTISVSGSIGSLNSSSGVFNQKSSEPNYYCKEIRLVSNIDTYKTYAFHYCYSLEKVMLSNAVTNISNYSFQNDYALKAIVLPQNITTLGSSSFNSCRSMNYLVIPQHQLTLGSTSFQNCSKIKSVIIPSTVTSIGTYAFYNCSDLQYVRISGAPTINGYAFQLDYSLKKLDILGNPSFSGYSAFDGCYSLENINISNLQILGSSAFSNCYNLKNVKFSSLISTINSSVFSYCTSITLYDFSEAASIPTLGATNAFNGINKICKIYVPDSLYEDWKIADNWSTYVNYVYKASEMPV